MNINLLLIRTAHLEELKTQYEALGIKFTYHQHGKGPFHYSTEIGTTVFEIYPLLKDQEVADRSVRLGFAVPDLASLLPQLELKEWKILRSLQKTPWGIQAVVQDRDGRKVELTQEEE